MHAVRNLSASPPPREAFSTSSPAAIFRLEEMQDLASFFAAGNASCALPFPAGNKAANDHVVVSGGFGRPLSSSSQQSTNPSFEESPSAQRNFDNRGGGDANGDAVGTSGSCSSNDGPSSSSSSITESIEIVNNVSDKQISSGNYRIWDHHPQGDRQRRMGDNSRIVNYGSKHYEQQNRYEWNSFGPMWIRDPQLQIGHLRQPATLPHMPATMPIFLPPPPPPFQHNYGCMPNPVVLDHSSENLRTDYYLKLHMDNYGWVSIYLIAGFRRIKRLTDNISLIVEALIPSVVVEVEVFSNIAA
ncbi:hypothetical protein KSP40_PGU022493 [Platanthera guangdongensis]|uniref:HTH La-type RNA-binding domain-containing protein n=1 Tax=Platanthera guangdongensis TaxID=2320717 RepID=A0ABR2LRU7_9ASPA